MEAIGGFSTATFDYRRVSCNVVHHSWRSWFTSRLTRVCVVDISISSWESQEIPPAITGGAPPCGYLLYLGCWSCWLTFLRKVGFTFGGINGVHWSRTALNCPNILSLAIPNHAHPQNTLTTHKVTAHALPKPLRSNLNFQPESLVTKAQSQLLSHGIFLILPLLVERWKGTYSHSCLTSVIKQLIWIPIVVSWQQEDPLHLQWITSGKYPLNDLVEALVKSPISFHFSVAIGASRLCRETWKVKQHGRSHRLQAIFLREFCQGWRALVTCAEVTKEKAGWSNDIFHLPFLEAAQHASLVFVIACRYP